MTDARQKALQAVYIAVEYVASKAMISITDHHDVEAWVALDNALKAVRTLERQERENAFLRDT